MPVLLVGCTPAEASARFGPSTLDAKVAAYQEVLEAAVDPELDQYSFIAVASGDLQAEVTRRLLDRFGHTQGASPLIALEGRADGSIDPAVVGHIHDVLGARGDLFPLQLGRVSGIGVAGNLPPGVTQVQAWVSSILLGDAVTLPSDGDFRSASDEQRRQAEREDMTQQISAMRGDLAQVKNRVRAVRREREALRRELAQVRGSTWVAAALTLRGAADRIARRLHTSRRRSLAILVALVLAMIAATAWVVAIVAGSVAYGLVSGGVLFGSLLLTGGLVVASGLVVRAVRRNSGRIRAIDERTKAVDRKFVRGVRRRREQERRRDAQLLRRTLRVDTNVQSMRSEVLHLHGAAASLGDRFDRSLSALQAELGFMRQDLDGRYQLLSAAVEQARQHSDEEIPRWFRAFEQRYNRRVVIEREQAQAMLNLFALAEVESPVPAMGGWAASPDVIVFLVEELIRLRPSLVVEFGSGVSTLWLALVIRQRELPTRIVALEHEPQFAQKTRELLSLHGVGDVADVRDAPLVASETDGTPWYDQSQLEDLHDVGLVFVDGPPAATGALARMPAVPVLKGRLAESCTIVLDDLVRAEEKEIAKAWRESLADFAYQELRFEKGAAIFRRGTARH